MGLFTPFGGNRNKKVTDYEYEKKHNSTRSRIMSRLTGSWGEKKKKMAELDNAIKPSMDHGGRTKWDDGADADEVKETIDRLKQHDKHLSLNAHDIEAAAEELKKDIDR